MSLNIRYFQVLSLRQRLALELKSQKFRSPYSIRTLRLIRLNSLVQRRLAGFFNQRMAQA
jgi:hypothetical protein